MNVEGQQVVLDEAPIFRLVLGHDTEISIVEPSSQPIRFASPCVSGTFRPDDIHGDLHDRLAIDAALTAMVVLLVGVQGHDLVAEESCCLRSRMGDQRLLPGEFELECVAEDPLQLLLDLLSFPRGPLKLSRKSSAYRTYHNRRKSGSLGSREGIC